ncbi:MAG: alpha/beta fold hydrolase [Ectobacillus sp.]
MKSNLLLLPGWGMDESVWQPLCRCLADVNFRHVHWRGLKDEQDIIKRVEEALKQEGQAILAGWSLGALAALQAAAVYPQHVDGLILIGGTARFVADKEYQHGWNPAFVKRMKKNLQDNRNRTLVLFDGGMFSEAEHEWPAAFKEMRLKFQEDSVSSLLAGLDYLLHQDARPILPALQMPLLLLHGEADKICPLSAAKFMEANTQAKLHIVANAGHAPHMTRAEECAFYIQSFVKENSVQPIKKGESLFEQD